MKKSILLFFAAAGLLTACDPVQSEKDFDPISIASDVLDSRISFTQTDVNGNPASDGNYFTYTTNPATQVSIFNYRSDGSENLLASGFAGNFTITAKRGSDPQQDFYIRVLNSDGTETIVKKTVTVFVQQELEPAVKLLASDSYGSKTWMWDTDAPDGCVWGNMGYCGGAGSEVALNGNGKWWGVTSEEEFMGQLKHSDTGIATGEESMDATMVIDDEGVIKCYDADGKLIRQGTYEVKNYNASDPTAWKVGDLMTSPGAILWPFEINSNGNKPTQFDIVYLTSDKLVLVYPDGGAFDGLGGWGEASFWHFKSNSDPEAMLVGFDNGGKSWTWDTEAPDGCVWGNMGYCGGKGSEVGLNGNGKWWGVTSEEEFMGQMQHSDTGAATGEESMKAYMTFGTEGTINSYDANGKQIRSGVFELNRIVGNEWKVADLKTTAGSILWPFEINSKGNKPTQFDVVYLTDNKLVLVYPDGGAFDGLGGWGEASFWRFKKK
ncbi:MAG: hypothetical protein IJV27_08355 [Prevotella sp.]|nr:hypothetical protein [Prevotella sp.]